MQNNKIENSENTNNIKTKENTKRHNGIIGFWKFVFAIIITVCHVNQSLKMEDALFLNGYILVDFFFLVSGYLLAKSAFNKKDSEESIGEETRGFLWKKIKSIFPYMLVSFIIYILIYSWAVKPYNKKELINSIWNLIFLETSGVKYTVILSQTWYISAMFISMLILYPLLRKYRKNFTHIIAPIIVIFVGGWLSVKYDTINKFEFTGLTNVCVLRAFFELALGTILYEIGEKIKSIKYTKLSKFLLSIIEIGGFISILIAANHNEPINEVEFVMLLILSISITLAFSEKTIFFNFTNKKLFTYIEKLSLPIYINHPWIIILINKIFTDISFPLRQFLVILLTLIFSIFINFVIEKIRSNKKFNTKVKKCFVISD